MMMEAKQWTIPHLASLVLWGDNITSEYSPLEGWFPLMDILLKADDGMGRWILLQILK